MSLTFMTANDPGLIGSLIPLIGMVALLALMYFIGIRPQQKQEKQLKEMRDNLEVGDEVTTIGGIIGKVVSIKEETVMIETGRDHTKIRMLRSAIKCVDVKASDAE